MGKRTVTKTPEGRQNILINLAINLAEKQLRDGSASSQLISHFLKLATVRDQLEIKKLESDITLSQAKVKAIENSSKIEELLSQAIDAMKDYGGDSDENFDDEEFD